MMNRVRIALSLFLLFPGLCLSSPVWAQSGPQATQDGPSFPDTAKYITTFLMSHGCTTYKSSGISSDAPCVSIANFDGCLIEIGIKTTITTVSNDPRIDDSQMIVNEPMVKIDLRSLDPTSIKTGRWKAIIINENDAGLAVITQLQAGGQGLALPVDNVDNATHLINALSHAITLCGGKKAAF
jgi:hypothetical protein